MCSKSTMQIRRGVTVVDVVKEVVLADIGMTDDEIVWQRDWRWYSPSSWPSRSHLFPLLSDG